MSNFYGKQQNPHSLTDWPQSHVLSKLLKHPYIMFLVLLFICPMIVPQSCSVLLLKYDSLSYSLAFCALCFIRNQILSAYRFVYNAYLLQTHKPPPALKLSVHYSNFILLIAVQPDLVIQILNQL